MINKIKKKHMWRRRNSKTENTTEEERVEEKTEEDRGDKWRIKREGMRERY